MILSKTYKRGESIQKAARGGVSWCPFLHTRPFTKIISSTQEVDKYFFHDYDIIFFSQPWGLLSPAGRRSWGLVWFPSICPPQPVEDDAQHWRVRHCLLQGPGGNRLHVRGMYYFYLIWFNCFQSMSTGQLG